MLHFENTILCITLPNFTSLDTTPTNYTRHQRTSPNHILSLPSPFAGKGNMKSPPYLATLHQAELYCNKRDLALPNSTGLNCTRPDSTITNHTIHNFTQTFLAFFWTQTIGTHEILTSPDLTILHTTQPNWKRPHHTALDKHYFFFLPNRFSALFMAPTMPLNSEYS